MRADRHEVVPGNVEFSVPDPQKRVPIIFSEARELSNIDFSVKTKQIAPNRRGIDR